MAFVPQARARYLFAIGLNLYFYMRVGGADTGMYAFYARHIAATRRRHGYVSRARPMHMVGHVTAFDISTMN